MKKFNIKLLLLLILFIIGNGAIAQIIQAEYFIDSDPGEGSGTAMSAQDGSLDNAIEAIFIDGISPVSPGIHVIGIRVKDSIGWGPAFKTVVSIESSQPTPAVNINLAEYFWDNDPGQGSGTALIAFDGNFDGALETAFGSNIPLPAPGIHKFCIRIKNRNNNWGTVFTQVISVENLVVPVIRVTTSECFWDNDPGQGNGTTLLAFDGNYDDAFEVVYKNGLSLPAPGMHKLCIRAKNRNNQWGPVFSTIVAVRNNSIPRLLEIQAGEAFWDTDPGQGSGIPLLAFDGNFNDAVETLSHGIFTGLLSVGQHKLCIRVKEATNTWSPVFTTVVFIDPCATSPSPVVTAGGSTTFCEGDSLLLTADAGYTSYKWVRGSTQLSDTTQSIYVKTSGFYKAIVTDGNSCPGASDVTVVTVVPINPSITIYGDTVFCQGNSVILDAGNDFDTYAWSTGGTGTFITVISDGAYNVTVTNDGCTSISLMHLITVNPNPGIPAITPSGPTAFCLGDSVTLTSSLSNSYYWSTGETTQSITVYGGGNYTVDVSNIYGCNAQSVAENVTVTSSNPDIIVNGSLNICDGESVILDAGTGYTGFSWSTGETTQMISVSTADTYTVTVTSVACVGISNPVAVSIYSAPAVPVITVTGSNIFCTGDSVILTSDATTNVWSDGQTTQSITVFNSGNYYVTSYNAFGCSATSSVEALSLIPVDNSLTLVGSQNICQGDTVLINAQPGYDSYFWSTGDTTSFIKVSESGTYYTTITNQMCSSISESVSVIAYLIPAIPTIVQIGSNQFCNGSSIELVSDVADTYLWSTGETSQSIIVYNSGSYYVNVYNVVGCSSTSDVVSVSAYPNPVPVITYTGSTSFCGSDSLVLTSNVSGNIIWNTGDTAQTIVVNSTADYTVTADNGNGCMATSSPITVTVAPLNPIITTSGSPTFCQGGSLVLHAGAGYDSYYWSTGETDSVIVASQAGDYTVDVVFGSCTNTSPTITVNVLPLPSVPTITVTGQTTFCDGGTVTLASSVENSYLWTDGQTDQSVVVSATDCYSVVVTDVNGCTRESSCENITVNPLPSPVITSSGSTNFCDGGSVQLNSNAASSYSWSTGEITSYIVASDSGDYVVSVTNSFGCTAASQPMTVTVNPVPDTPVITAIGDNIFCSDDSLILTSGIAENYLWTTGETTQSITVDQTGTYYLTVSNSYGCSQVSNSIGATVSPAQSIPYISMSGPTNFCGNDSVILTSTVADSYSWSTGDSSQSIVVYTTGTYYVEASNTVGCTEVSSPLTINVSPAQEQPIISTVGNTTFCEGDSIVLSSSTADSYIWNNGATSQTITVDVSGSYTVEAYNTFGCSTISTAVAVTVNPNPSLALITPGGVKEFCEGDSVVLTSSAEDSYLWSTGDDTRDITVSSSGLYIVTVTNLYNCSLVSASEQVTVFAAPGIPTISTSGDSLYSDSATTHQWYLDGVALAGADEQNIKAPQTGNYLVEITNEDGCTAQSQVVYVITSIETITADGIDLTVYPNPFVTDVTFIVNGLKDYKNLSLSIFDIVGKEVSSITNINAPMFMFERDNIPNGVYFFKVYYKDKTIGTGKLIAN